MNTENLNKLVTEALAIEASNAKEAGALGYMARALVQATMPHKQNADGIFLCACSCKDTKDNAYRESSLRKQQAKMPLLHVLKLAKIGGTVF